jgi:type I restriction enzyme S subunit
MPAILRKFREAVLEAAVSGRLTEVWRRENKKSFNWERVVLSDVAESRLGKMLDKVKNRGDLRPYLRNINVRWFVFDLSDIQELRVSPAEASELAVAQGDVLVCEGGEPGRCAVWRGPEGQYIYQKALHRVRAGPSLIPEWICYCLKNAATSGRLEASFTGTTIKHLTGVSLAGFDFRLPPIAEQIEAKRRVEELLALADQLEAKYRAAVERVERLTPSVLAKAFRGELVPQDPEDEPASVLLERIRAESSAEDRSGSAGRSPGRRAGTGGLRQAAVRAGGAAGKKRGRRSRAS